MKKSSIIISAVVVVLFASMAWTLANNKEEIDSNNVVKTIEDKVSVTVASAEMQKVSNKLELTGIAEPIKEVIVASESSGKIVEASFKMGDSVREGMVLAKVNDTNQRLALENAQLNLTKYEDDYKRYQVLREGDAVSEAQLRDMKIGFENASIQLEKAQKQFDDTKIVAPFSGVIITKDTESGSYVNVGSSIVKMADISQLKIMLSVSEANIYKLSKGQEVTVTADVYPGVNYNGIISSISPQGSESHTYPVEVVIENTSKNPLKAGTYVNAIVSMEEQVKSLMIPRDAIVSSVKAPSVYVVKGETVKLVKIETGRDYNSYLEVVSGINEGDQVITNGQINLTDGASISIK